MNIPRIDLPRVVILGAGFAGLQLAKRINTKHYQVVLMDEHNYHTFQPLLYQVASAGLEPDSISYPIRKTLTGKKNIFYRLTKVNLVDTELKVVRSEIGDLEYDYLVVATGATNNFFGNDSIEDNAMPMKKLTDALDLRSKMLENFERALNTTDLNKRKKLMNFVIVGAGPTGVELAGALAELKSKVLPKDFPDLDLRAMEINVVEASDRVLAAMSSESSKKADAYLRKLGVNIWTETFVEGVHKGTVSTNKNVDFESDTVIWAAGVKANVPKGLEGFELASNGRVVVNDYLKVKDEESVFVLGDASYLEAEGYPRGLPMLGAVAMQQGVYLSKYFGLLAKGKEPKAFRYKDKGTMATVGRNLAVVELKKIKFQGMAAWATWMFVHLMLLVGFRNRMVVFINWAWAYFRYNSGLRLIIRPFRRGAVEAKSSNPVVNDLEQS